ncbi:MAG TPA: glycoside hydrolase family 3 N-terminal domain-containing protein [Candidatus Binatia bacterium]|nr:glycoside hydrolase family 3 N-terminal domain-containing protein [Candidatus Binatia bacterium]
MIRAVAAACVALVVAGAAPARETTPPSLAQLVGQKLVVTMQGTTPTASLLARVRRGEVGGVIVHGFNFRTSVGLRRITRSLRAAAAAGGRPKLLISVDQEGGEVKTVRWAPPSLAPAQMGSRARDQGRRTGAALRALGINVDLAPVADVPGSRASAVYRQGRTWSFDAEKTALQAGDFALGLGAGHAVATMKHFPGLGLALRDTDRALVRIRAPRSRLAPGLVPFRRGIRQAVPVIMLSNAIYDAYDPVNAAGWSRAIASTLLRRELGFSGVSMTDSLDGAAHVRGIPPNGLAIGAANAGTDLILLTGSEAATRSVFTSLLRAAQSGRVGRVTLETSYARILRLKARL